MKKLVVTGGAGFIGSNFVRLALERLCDWQVVNLDCLTYAGNLENLADLEPSARYTLARVDITDAAAVDRVFAAGVDAVVHFAAESHVDRSVLDAGAFVRTNVLGTHNLLESARRRGCGRFVHVSTDEVYGSLGPEGLFTEETPLAPSSPYSASKAGSDLLVRAAFHTHAFPGIITRCSNNYGPYQLPEKLIPLMITNALDDQPLPVYGDGQNVRDWIFVTDHCEALLRVLEAGAPGEVYNLGGNAERRNLDVVHAILDLLGKPKSLVRFVEDRPGHDRRYAMATAKVTRELGWRPRHSFEQGLEATVRWYVEHEALWRRVKNGEYLDYYRRQYEERLVQAPGGRVALPVGE